MANFGGLGGMAAWVVEYVIARPYAHKLNKTICSIYLLTGYEPGYALPHPKNYGNK